MIHEFFHFWIWHPLRLGNGYNFWSGIGSDVGEITLLGMVLAIVKKHNCHVKGCRSVFTQIDPMNHHPACKKHHSHKDLIGVNPHASDSNSGIEG